MGNCPTSSQTKLTSLENPPEPATPSYEENMVVSLQNYPSYGCTEFTVCIGDKLTVVSDDGDFLMVKSATTGCESYIPSNYIAKVTDSWLFTGINRNKAVELLMLPDNQTGAFLVRESESDTDCYSLSVLRRASSSCVKHYRISRLKNGWLYISPRLTFPSLHHLVEHYSESSDGLCCQLGHPCFIQGSDNVRPLPTVIRRPTINWKDISRSVIFRRKRTESGNSLVSEGLREAISSYIYMTEGDDQSWDS